MRKLLFKIFTIGLILSLNIQYAYSSEKNPNTELNLSSVFFSENLIKHSFLLIDKEHQFNFLDILENQQWISNKGTSLYLGSQDATIWLKIKVFNDSDQYLKRWISLGSTRLQNIEYYLLDEQNTLKSHALAGANIPNQAHSLHSATSRLFEIQLAAQEQATVLIKIHSNTMLYITADIWEPLSYRETENINDLKTLTSLFIMITLGIYLLVAGLVRKDYLVITMSLWLISYAIYELSFLGYLHYFLFQEGGQFVSAAPLITGLVTTQFMFLFFLSVFQAHNLKKWKKLIIFELYISLIAMLYGYFVDLKNALMLAQSATFILVISLPFLGFIFWKKRLPNTEFFIIASLLFFSFLAHRILSVMGFIDMPMKNGINIWALTFLLFSLLLSLGFTLRSAELYRKEIATQKKLLSFQALEQAKLEEAVNVRTQELQESLLLKEDALQTKTHFLTRVSHDLRSPLTSILGFAQIIQHNDNPLTRYHAGLVIMSARRLLALVNDLIDYASGDKGLQKLNLKPLYVQSFLESISKEAEILATKNNNQLFTRLPHNLPKLIEADSKRLHQILINLLANACKFTQKGRIEFNIQYESINNNQGCFTFSILDNGIGIEDNLLPSIFEPFQRQSSFQNIRGLGLGLAIVKQLADLMQGELQAQSKPTHGTQISFKAIFNTLEEDFLKIDSIAVSEKNVSLIDGKHKHIWLIEDSPLILEFLQTKLKSLNFSVQAFTHGQDVKTLLDHPETAAPDIIVTDYHLPYYNGVQLAEQSKERWPETPILLISAGMGENLDETQLFDAILLKPIEVSVLCSTLAYLLKLTTEASNDQHELTLQQIRHILSPSEMDELATLVEVFAVSKIMKWATHLKEKRPESTLAADSIWTMARLSEIENLQKLVQ